VLIFVLELVPIFSQRIIAGINFQDSAGFRLASWSQGFQIIKQNIIVGVGYNNLEQVKLAQGFLTQAELQSHSAAGIDSSLMVIWSTTGIIGLTAFLYFIFKNIYLGFKEFFRQRAKLSANMGLAVAGILIGILIHSFFVNSLLYPPIIAAIMFVLAVFYVLVKNNSQDYLSRNFPRKI
jgi:O-antigen ligase